MLAGVWMLVGLAPYFAFPLAVVAVRAFDESLVRSARLIIDTLLLALVPAGLLTMWAVAEEWPFEIRGGRGHGFGTTGGEVNVAFFGALHLLLWIALMFGIALLRRRRNVESATRVR